MKIYVQRHIYVLYNRKTWGTKHVSNKHSIGERVEGQKYFEQKEANMQQCGHRELNSMKAKVTALSPERGVEAKPCGSCRQQ